MGRKKVILIIDDEKDLVEMLQFQFEAQGFQTITAQNGQEGLERLKTTTPDLIILDMNMPKMGGVEFYTHICGADSKPKYPVFVLTARANMEKLFKEFEVQGFMAKPFEINRLIAEIERIVNKEKKENVSNATQSAQQSSSSVQKKSDISVQEEFLLKDAMLDTGQTHSKSRMDAVPSGADDKKQKKDERPEYREVQREIFILENDPIVSYELRMIFSKYNCLIYFVSNPEECLDKATHHSVDLVILKHFVNSVNMEGLTTRLKEMPKFNKIPIILYDSIFQETEKEKSTGEKKGALLLNEQGRKMLEKVKALLGL